MRIAHIAPVSEPVHADTHGEVELYIHYLVCELARRGHNITLFASRDSASADSGAETRPNLTLIPLEKEALGHVDLTSRERVFYELELIEKLLLRADTVSVVHSHIGYKLLPFAPGMIRRPVDHPEDGEPAPPTDRRWLFHLGFLGLGFYSGFIQAGVGQFGSGWCWIAVKDGKLAIMKTPNGENPLVHGAKPILGCDVWEHSYYIDYRNARPKYLEAWFDNLVNWAYVEELFESAQKDS